MRWHCDVINVVHAVEVPVRHPNLPVQHVFPFLFPTLFILSSLQDLPPRASPPPHRHLCQTLVHQALHSFLPLIFLLLIHLLYSFILQVSLLIPNYLFLLHPFPLHRTTLPIPLSPHNSQNLIPLNFHLLLFQIFRKCPLLCKLLPFHHFILPPKIFFPHLPPFNLLKCLLHHIAHLHLI